MGELRIKVKGGLELGLNLGKGEKWGDGTKHGGRGSTAAGRYSPAPAKVQLA